MVRLSNDAIVRALQEQCPLAPLVLFEVLETLLLAIAKAHIQAEDFEQEAELAPEGQEKKRTLTIDEIIRAMQE